MKPQVFKTTFHKYRWVEQIGEGGCGRVIKVSDEDDQACALKYLKPEQCRGSRRKRFQNELMFCAKSDDPHVVKVLDWGLVTLDGSDCPFYVMPYYAATLRKLMREGVSPDKVLGLFVQLLAGVEAAHKQGVIHRDLKPENVLYDATNDVIVVADFGIAHFAAHVLETAVATSDHERLANFTYAAPEQREAGGTVDRRADIYALGMILNEMFTGVAPLGLGYRRIQDAEPPHAYLDPLVEKMLQHSAGSRPPSVENVRLEIAAREERFVSEQKLTKLRETAGPLPDIADPLVAEPVRLVGVDIQGGELILKLNHSVSREWATVFRDSGAPGPYLLGYGPQGFSFSQNRASVPVPHRPPVVRGGTFYQRIVDDFKKFLTSANAAYRSKLINDARVRQEVAKKALQREIEEEERRQSIRSQIKI